MIGGLLDKLPSGAQVSNAADAVSTVVCYGNAWNRAKPALGLFAATLCAHMLTRGAEDLEDLVGIVEEVVDSHRLEAVRVESVDSDRVNATAVPVPFSTSQRAERREGRRRPDGTVEHKTVYTCDGPTLLYQGEDGEDATLACGTRAGKCPTGKPYVSVFKNGLRSCVFGTPTIHCRINESAQACHYKGTCPRVGDSVTMARATSDDSLSCATGSWNRCRIVVRYVAPETGRERTQTFLVPMSGPGASKFAVDSEIPVYYSRKRRKISLRDSNVASFAGWIVGALAIATICKTLDAASFLSKPVCALRLGLRVAGRVDETLERNLGFDLM